jgi:HSP20 family protein
MPTTIHPVLPPSRKAVARLVKETFRRPNYECQEQRDAMKLIVYVPGVDASAVEIEARRGDLIVTARKPHIVRVNWQALHLEAAQQNYQLRLRLGNALDYGAMQADISEGVLTVTLPKRMPEVAPRFRHVA